MEGVKKNIIWTCPCSAENHAVIIIGQHAIDCECEKCFGNFKISFNGNVISRIEKKTGSKTGSAPEKILETFANVILIIGIIAGVVLFCVGIWSFIDFGGYGLLFVLGAVLVVLIAAVQWAFVRVFVNISNSLKEINRKTKNTACPNCQTQNDIDAKFCIDCGKEF